MKEAREWVKEMSQSGAFDLINDIDEAEMFIRKVQADAYSSAKNESQMGYRSNINYQKVGREDSRG